MSLKLIPVLMSALLASIFAPAQLTGTVKSNGIAVKDVNVCNLTQDHCVNTDAAGNFSLAGSVNDIIVFSHVNFLSSQLKLTVVQLAAAQNITLTPITTKFNAPQGPSSSWIGAKVGYNFDGFSDDDLDFIGSAKIKLNMITQKNELADYGVIGNISDFISKKEKEDGDKDLQKLVLSVTGLNVGMYGEWFFKPKDTKDGEKVRSNCSVYATSGYRLNTYKYVTKDSLTVNLSQFKTSVGFQFEGLTFEEEGKLNLSAEASLYVFDPNRYNTIFNEKKRALISLEIGAIIPVKNKIGFFVSATLAPNVSGVFLAGIILKP